MSHRWEHEDEYLQLRLRINRAHREGDAVLVAQLQAQIQVFDDMRWQLKTTYFTELSPYSTLVEALEQTASSLIMPFPNLNDPHHKTGSGRFMFHISDGERTVQIWPMESRGYYDVEVYEYPKAVDKNSACYKGQTRSLEEATIVLSRWFVERCSISMLHSQFLWMSQEPLQISGPRMTFE